jgi:murein DD-endopeptidase MepM/ murein hydrolase activator NlpD
MALLAFSAGAQSFHLPTANQALLQPGGEEKYFVGTVGKNWVSGTFGSVRSDGWQMHEGIDVRCLQRDRKGEATDPVLATADGKVVYISTKAGLSNYGKYIVIHHVIDGLDIYSLYAHLSEIAPGLAAGQTVKTGQTIAIMGRTSNTHQTITKDRAHLHFELNLLYNDRFAEWFKKSIKERNDHGDWNGQNLAGIDPRLILQEAYAKGPAFNLLTWLQNRTELCRVLVTKTNFSFVRRYKALIQPNPLAQQQGIAGYEMSLDYNGVPFRLIPRAASEIKGKGAYQLLSVNEAEYKKNHCRRLVVQHGARWQLGPKGTHLLDLLTY